MNSTQRHARATRALHTGVALAVIFQLGASLVMEGPRAGRPDGLPLIAHQYVGLASLALILAFWLNLMARRIGTAPAALLPWFSAARRQALWDDIIAHGRALRRLRLPAYDENAPLASAVHGLGLLLMTLMAASGAVWFLLTPAAPASVAMEVHQLFANLAWAYLIAHAGLAVLHHLRREASLTEMWSLRGVEEGQE